MVVATDLVARYDVPVQLIQLRVGLLHTPPAQTEDKMATHDYISHAALKLQYSYRSL